MRLKTILAEFRRERSRESVIFPDLTAALSVGNGIEKGIYRVCLRGKGLGIAILGKQSSCNKGTEKDEEEKRRETEYRKINERYEIWKKHTQLLYDIVISRELEWPSLTVEWLPDRKEQPGNDYLARTMILGTYAAENGPNYLMRAEVPEQKRSQVNVVQKIKHERQVNRARYMPQKPFIIATKTVRPEVYVNDYRKHSDKHTSDGGSFNTRLRLGDHRGVMVYLGVQGRYVRDVAWHPKHEYSCGSVGNDKCLHVWDLRAQSIRLPFAVCGCSSKEGSIS
ncbi:histone-binding protein MSI1-like [Primulina huaijiensis]|uniref:histone-binding protein MSI1-like n=1 Tax=Primulina huaijiensis TaxID=1492673 RepID=UPI003CC790B5